MNLALSIIFYFSLIYSKETLKQNCFSQPESQTLLTNHLKLLSTQLTFPKQKLNLVDINQISNPVYGQAAYEQITKNFLKFYQEFIYYVKQVLQYSCKDGNDAYVEALKKCLDRIIKTGNSIVEWIDSMPLSFQNIPRKKFHSIERVKAILTNLDREHAILYNKVKEIQQLV